MSLRDIHARTRIAKTGAWECFSDSPLNPTCHKLGSDGTRTWTMFRLLGPGSMLRSTLPKLGPNGPLSGDKTCAQHGASGACLVLKLAPTWCMLDLFGFNLGSSWRYPLT